MKRILLLWLPAFVCTVLLAAPLPAGQIVTQRLRSWARTAAATPATRKPPVPNSVAVLYFSNRTGRSDISPLQKGLSLMLASDLARVKGLRVIERARVQALYDALGLKPSSPLTEDQALRLGRMLGAFYVVSGTIVKGLITDLKVMANFLEVPNDMLLDQPVSAGDLADLVSMEKEILFDLIDAFQLSLTPAQLKHLERPVSDDIDALYLLFRAIDASDRGKYETAAALYKNALRQDPQLSVAPAALAELQTEVFAARTAKTRAPAPSAAAPKAAHVPPPKTAAAPTAPTAAAAPPAVKPAQTGPPVPAQPTTPTAAAPEAAPPSKPPETPPAGAKPAPPEEKKLSTSTIVAIGVGAAAVVGIAAAAAGGGGGGGDQGGAPAPAPPEPEPTPQGPKITGSDPPSGSAVSCSGATITFTFDRDMDAAAGQIGVSIQDWRFTGTFTDARTYVITWEDNCPQSGSADDLPSSITFVFANFQDTSQNPLEGDTEFTFDLTM